MTEAALPLKSPALTSMNGGLPESTLTIARRRAPGEFEKFREAMLSAVQRLASHAWTDYNLHDPGVTILEQLCYVLTDINHRTSYDIDEILADFHQCLALHKHGLFTPQEALSCRPVTRDDILKYILDKVPDLSRVSIKGTHLHWEKAGRTIEFPWLYSIRVHSREPVASRTHHAYLRKKVIRCFHCVRNLGEDLYQVEIAPDKHVYLEGHIYVDESIVESAIESQTLAKVYMRAQSYLLGEVETAEEPGNVEGPLLESLHFTDEALALACEPRTMAGLIAALNDVDGVREVDNLGLWIQTDGEFKSLSFTESVAQDDTLRLVIPELETDYALSLVCSHRKLAHDVSQVQAQYKALVETRRLKRETASQNIAAAKRPVQRKDLLSYVSVQEHFPSNYGINRFGVPAHAPAARRAQAKQLKGYLLLFDQLMLDHLAMLDNVKNFFSDDLSQMCSYPTGLSNEATISGNGSLYQKNPDNKFLLGLEAYDNYPQRKLRVFDYLCAMNGRDREVFGWEFRNPYFSQDEKQKRLLDDKRRHLQLLHEYGKNRAGAFNYTVSSWGKTNLSFLEKRVRLILGVSDRRLSTVYPMVKRGFTHSEETLGYHFNGKNANPDSPLATAFYQNIEHVSYAQFSRHFVPVPQRKVKDEASWKTFHYVQQCAFGNLKNLQDLLFQCGANLDNYRLGQVKNKKQLELFINLCSSGQENWLYLLSFKSKKEAVLAANQLRYCIQHLNMSMEGVHLIEHNLLLPLDRHLRPTLEGLAHIKAYTNQVSVLLPAWSARFRDIDFQHYVGDIILQEAPAHLYIRIYWLGYAQMEKFEVLFKNWCDEKLLSKNPDKINRLSRKLVGFLMNREKKATP